MPLSERENFLRAVLTFTLGLYPPAPPENVGAPLGALEGFRTYWSDGRGA